MSTSLEIVDEMMRILRRHQKKLRKSRQQKYQTLDDFLVHRRPSREQVLEYPFLAPSLYSVAHDIERQQRQLQLQSKLKEKPDREELESQQILLPNSNQISNVRNVKPTIKKELEQKGILPYGNLKEYLHVITFFFFLAFKKKKASSLQPIAQQVEQHRNIAKEYNSPLVNEGRNVDETIAPRIQGTARQLEFMKKKRMRVAPEEMVDSGLVYSLEMAHTLHSAALELEHLLKTRVNESYLRKKHLLPFRRLVCFFVVVCFYCYCYSEPLRPIASEISEFLKRRPSKDDILEYPELSSALSPTAHELDKTLKKQRVERGIRDRRNSEDLVEVNVLYSDTVAPALQPAAADLEKQLGERPTEATLFEKHIIQNQNLSAAHQDAAAQLDKELQHRKDWNPQIPVQGNTAPSLEATSRELEKKIKEDKIERTLEHRPSVVDLVHSNIIYSEDMAKSLQGPAKELEHKLEHRSSVKGVKRAGLLPYSKLSDSIQGAAFDLEKALQSEMHERTAEHIQAAQLKLAPALQMIAQELEKQMKEDTLETFLPHRPAPEEVLGEYKDISPSLVSSARKMDLLTKRVSIASQLSQRKTKEEVTEEQILKNPQLADSLQPVGHTIERHLQEKQQNRREASDIAPSLQSRIKTLEERRKKHQLESLLLHRPNEEEMLRKHRLLYTIQMASALQRYAKELENHLRMRVGEEYLKNKGLLPYFNIPPAQRAAALAIDEHLATHLTTRNRSGSDPSHLAPSLRATARKLVKRQEADHLSQQLRSRHDSNEVLAHPHVASSLAPAAQDMERILKQKRLSDGLHGRHSSEELEERNILYSAQMSAAIQPAAHNVESLLENQPTKKSLQNSGVLQNPNLSSDLQPVGAELAKKLTQRPQPKEMYGTLDPRLHAAAKRLERAQRSSLIESQLQWRSDINEVTLYPLTMASSIQPAALNVEMALQSRRSRQELIDYGLIHNPKLSSALAARGDSLSQGLRNRPKASSVVDTHLAGSLQNTAKKLEFHQRRESLSQLLNGRPTWKDESVQKTLHFSNIAPALQPAALNLEEELALRPALQDMSRGGLFPFSFLPEHLRPTAWDLQRALERAKLASGQQLEAHGYPNLASSLHGAARKTETHLRRKSLEQHLRNRPDPEDILPHIGLAPSIQPAANALAHHLRRRSLADAFDSRPALEEIWQRSGRRVHSQDLVADDHSVSKKEIRITEMSNELSENIDVATGEEITRILRQCDAQVFTGGMNILAFLSLLLSLL
ncbi:hypothetical protein RFI_35084 [Reticulomyxa filosa]|uniref:Uncharacterized protein n=1 Tax=Reticulomyxa filosa TaxID=46433 RepID=X6LLW9_RETFI|nr:hypothetical protein RFI_35084 [Reticulomyxa filosa]|eukprot:ETO02351.1 hypothetical protein RFI_35084 [Reticulomyxa filosa]